MKEYISIISKCDESGKILPLKVVFSNGDICDIDKCEDVGNRASFKSGGLGHLYRIEINGIKKNLFWDDKKWFMD